MFEAVPFARAASPRLWARFLRLASHIPKHLGPRHSALGHPVDMDLIAKRAFTGALHHNKPAINKLFQTSAGGLVENASQVTSLAACQAVGSAGQGL